jgi:hypothetical protein
MVPRRERKNRGRGSGAWPRVCAGGGGLVWWPTTPRVRRRRAAVGGWCGAIAWTWAVEGGEVWVYGPATGPVAGADLR